MFFLSSVLDSFDSMMMIDDVTGPLRRNFGVPAYVYLHIYINERVNLYSYVCFLFFSLSEG